MTDSQAPLPTNTGLKYAIIAGVLIAGALALLVCSPGGEEEEAPIALPVLDAGTPANTSQFESGLELAPEEPDLGPADAGAEEAPSGRRSGRRAAPTSCEGTVPAAALQAAVGRYSGQVRNCYERALRQNNMLQGRVTVSLRIGEGGNVTSANASGNLGSAVNSCVTSVARSWRLVAPTGGTCAQARVPFNMTPSN